MLRTEELAVTYNDVGSAVSAIDSTLTSVVNGGVGPVQYSDAGTPTTPNGGVLSQDVTLVGAAAGPVGLHNVAAGSTAAGSTDAVNGGQLNTLGDSVATNFGGGSTYDPVTGTVTAPTYAVTTVNPDGTTVTSNVTNVGDALDTHDTSITNLNNTVNTINNGGGIKYFHANSTLADSQANGTDSVAVGPEAVADGVNAVAIGNGASASEADSVALGGGATTTAAVATTGATINGTAYTFAGGAPAGVVSIGSAGNERQLQNVAAGQVSATSTDAVSGGAGPVQYSNADTPTTPNGGTPSQDLTLVGAAPGPVVLHNVASGSVTANSTDAVNGGQLYSWTLDPNNPMSNTSIYNQLGTQVGKLNRRINEVESAAYAGTAAAMAMRQAPYVVGKTTYFAGIAGYKGEGALGVSLRKTAENGRWSLEGGISANRNSTGVYIGIGGVID